MIFFMSVIARSGERKKSACCGCCNKTVFRCVVYGTIEKWNGNHKLRLKQKQKDTIGMIKVALYQRSIKKNTNTSGHTLQSPHHFCSHRNINVLFERYKIISVLIFNRTSSAAITLNHCRELKFLTTRPIIYVANLAKYANSRLIVEIQCV